MVLTANLHLYNEGQVIVEVLDAQFQSRQKAPQWTFPRDPGMCVDTEVPTADECVAKPSSVMKFLRGKCLGRAGCSFTPEEIKVRRCRLNTSG